MFLHSYYCLIRNCSISFFSYACMCSSPPPLPPYITYVLSSDYSAKPCLNSKYVLRIYHRISLLSYFPFGMLKILLCCFATFLCMSFVFLYAAFHLKLYYHILFFNCLLPFVFSFSFDISGFVFCCLFRTMNLYMMTVLSLSMSFCFFCVFRFFFFVFFFFQDKEDNKYRTVDLAFFFSANVILCMISNID